MRLTGWPRVQAPSYEKPAILPDGDPGAVVIATVPPTREPAAPIRDRRVVCEFCSCEIGPDGSYKKLSAEAREMRDRERTIETLREELTAAKKTASELRTALDAAIARDKAEHAERGGVRIFSESWLAQFRKKQEGQA